MKLGKKKLEGQTVYTGELTTDDMNGNTQIAYCSHCGRHLDQVFYKGELILVEIPGQRPHYGRIIQPKQEQEGTSIIVEIGGNEKESVLIDYISKVG